MGAGSRDVAQHGFAYLTLLNEGPSAHIRSNAYKYRKMLDGELARVRRVKEIQLRTVLSTGTAVATALFAVANVLGRMYNGLLVQDVEMAGIVAGAVVLSLVLCCVLCGGCAYYWRRRPHVRL